MACKKCSNEHNTLLNVDSVVQTGNVTAARLVQENTTGTEASTFNYVNTGNAVARVGRVFNGIFEENGMPLGDHFSFSYFLVF